MRPTSASAPKQVQARETEAAKSTYGANSIRRAKLYLLRSIVARPSGVMPVTIASAASPWGVTQVISPVTIRPVSSTAMQLIK